MTQFPHDQFAKNLLESLLAPLGQIDTSLTINSEVREIDVYFTPLNTDIPSDLGLIAQCVARPAVFEPFRNPVSTFQIRSCMSKLYDLHNELIRQAKRESQKLSETDLPNLWILTPTLAAQTLTGFGAITEIEVWGNGVYLLPPLQKTGIIVIHQLPVTPATLWLRLLGKGNVQARAIEEVAALPRESSYRENALDLFSDLRAILSSKPDIETEERELIMQLSPLYLEQIRSAEQRGMEQGERELIVRLLTKRVGNLSPSALAQIQSLPLAKLEELGSALLDFQGMEDLTMWLADNN
jgi:hypothetical protein